MIKVKKIKILLIVLVAITVLFATAVFASQVKDDTDSGAADKTPLNEMSAEDCYRTLLEYGFVLPEGYGYEEAPEEENIALAKEFVDYAYENGGIVPAFNYTGIDDFARNVGKVVVEYEGFEYEGFYDWYIEEYYETYLK